MLEHLILFSPIWDTLDCLLDGGRWLSYVLGGGRRLSPMEEAADEGRRPSMREEAVTDGGRC